MLPAEVQRPSYDRSALKPGVVHIGIGAFHRAHQAPVFETFAQRGDLRWGIVGASLRSAAVRDALLPQDWLYSLVVECGADRITSVIGALRGVIVAPEDPRRLIEAIAFDQTHIVTVTVTEKGYKLDPASGLLLEDDPNVQSDVADLSSPATMPGYLAAGLQLRKERGLPPITIISCDNIAGNGSKLQAGVTHIARKHDSRLAEWVERHCAFPDTMVDRIVPATTDADVELTRSRLGLVDLATVRTEPFCQWVIQDRFAGPAPDFERAGVQITTDLAPWEQAKLRLLNGAAFCDGLSRRPCGYRNRRPIRRAALGPCFRLHAVGRTGVDFDRAWRTQRCGVPENVDAPVRQFGPEASGSPDRDRRFSEDSTAPRRRRGGSSRARSATRSHCSRDRGVDALAKRPRRSRSGFDVDDPLASTTERLASGAANAPDQARALLSLGSVFPPRLRDDLGFQGLVAHHLQDLNEHGARATVERFLSRQTVATEGKRCG